jgi:transglutaminase-like putative cysteine protease
MVLAFFAVVMGASGAGDADGFVIGPVPGWVRAVEVPSGDALDPAEAADGRVVVLVDRQSRLEPRESFYRNVTELVNERGVQTGSDIRASFNPSFQRLVIHYARVIRDGVVRDGLVSARIRVVDDSAEDEDFVINGGSVCRIHLTDVRVGDRVEYAYSVLGAHPSLPNLWNITFSAAWDEHVGRIFDRFVFPKPIPTAWRAFRDAPPPVERADGDDVEWVWDSSPSLPFVAESDAPGWYDAAPHVQVATVQSWADVVAWGLPLYADASPLPDDVVAALERIRLRHASVAERAAACLLFVQDDLRYLGTGRGVGMFRPRPIDETVASRFGDCKDKTLLLVRMLRALTIPAWPVLVNSVYRREVADWLPAADDFDHVITAIEADGRLWFVDPTVSGQGGTLGTMSCIEFGKGLILREGETDLTTIPVEPEAVPDDDITWTITSSGVGQPGRLDVRTVARGGAADHLRALWDDTPRSRLGENFANFYRNTFPELRPIDPLVLTDNGTDVVVTESYEIPTLWRFDGTNRRYTLDFGAGELRNKISVPPEGERRAPYGISGPLRIVQRIVVHLHEPWPLDAESSRRESAGCVLTQDYDRAPDGRTLTFTYGWTTARDFVEAGEVDAYRRLAQTALDETWYQLSTPGVSASGEASRGRAVRAFAIAVGIGGVVVVAVALAVGLAAVLWVTSRRARKPPPLPPESSA